MRAQNMEKITSIDNKARARALQDTSRAQQCTTGKPSTQPRNSDTALPTIRPAPVLPEEHHDTADREDHRQKEATEKAKPTHTQPGSNLVEVEDNADWTPPAPQPVEVSTLDAAPPVTKPAPDTNVEGLNDLTLEADTEATDSAAFRIKN